MIHILPINDIKPHQELSTCGCNPTIEALEDGEIMIIHNSFDGREEGDPNEPKPKGTIKATKN